MVLTLLTCTCTILYRTNYIRSNVLQGEQFFAILRFMLVGHLSQYGTIRQRSSKCRLCACLSACLTLHSFKDFHCLPKFITYLSLSPFLCHYQCCQIASQSLRIFSIPFTSQILLCMIFLPRFASSCLRTEASLSPAHIISDHNDKIIS